MMVLTKSQAFLAYKLGLLLGFSTRWQDYVTELGSVIGSGFLWRQIARQLVGLVPGWGIIPKVAVAYSGTYVVGNAILGWYLTGRKLTPQQMRELYAQAFDRGKEYARKLSEKLPKPRIGKRKIKNLTDSAAVPELSIGEIPLNTSHEFLVQEKNSKDVDERRGMEGLVDSTPKREESDKVERKIDKKQPFLKGWRFSFRKTKKTSETENTRMCPQCGKCSAANASYCQYCGMKLDR